MKRGDPANHRIRGAKSFRAGSGKSMVAVAKRTVKRHFTATLFQAVDDAGEIKPRGSIKNKTAFLVACTPLIGLPNSQN